MPRTRRPYSAEFRHRLVELVRGGQSPEELARKFEPSANAIRNWVVQAARDEAPRGWPDHRREGRSAPPAPRGAGAAGGAGDFPKSRGLVRQGDHVDPVAGVRVRERPPGRRSDRHRVPCARGLPQRVLRVAAPRPIGAGAAGRRADDEAAHDPPRVARDVRGAPGARGTGCPGHSRQPQAGGTAHAGGQRAGREPAQVGHHHDAGFRRRSCRSGSSTAMISCRRPRPRWSRREAISI